MARGQPKPLLKQVREIAIAALEERRGLVIYSRIDAQEMDQMARKVERDALDHIRAALPEALSASKRYHLSLWENSEVRPLSSRAPAAA